MQTTTKQLPVNTSTVNKSFIKTFKACQLQQFLSFLCRSSWRAKPDSKCVHVICCGNLSGPCSVQPTKADAVRWRCLEFQHRAVTPAGSESARFYK